MSKGKVLPPDIGPVISSLNLDLGFIYVRWSFYNHLFGDSASVSILNRYAGLAFRLIQDTLWDDVILSICRLADPSKMAGHQNLVIEALIPLIRANDDGPLADQLANELENFRSLIDELRTLRNKRIAHNDYEATVARYSGPSILVGVSPSTIRTALENAGRMLNLVNGYYRGVDFRHEQSFTNSLSGGDALVFALRRLAKFDDSERTS